MTAADSASAAPHSQGSAATTAAGTGGRLSHRILRCLGQRDSTSYETVRAVETTWSLIIPIQPSPLPDCPTFRLSVVCFQGTADRYYDGVSRDSTASSTHPGAMVIQFMYTGEHLLEEALFTLEGEHVVLWAAKTVVEMHGGSVYVHAGARGGAMLVIELPMNRAANHSSNVSLLPAANLDRQVRADEFGNQSILATIASPPARPVVVVMPRLSEDSGPISKFSYFSLDRQVHADEPGDERVLWTPAAEIIASPPARPVAVMARLSVDSGPVSQMSFSNTEVGLDP